MKRTVRARFRDGAEAAAFFGADRAGYVSSARIEAGASLPAAPARVLPTQPTNYLCAQACASSASWATPLASLRS